MAGDWIPVETTTPRKAEVVMIAKKIGVSRREVMGSLLEFWVWCQEQTTDGNVDVHVDACESLLDLPKGMCAAMTEVKWLVITPQGFTIPHWDRMLSKGAKSRLQKNIRQQKWRENGPENVDAPVDAKAPLEKRREEKSKENTGGSNHLPSFSQSDIHRVLSVYPLQSGLRGAEYQVGRILVEMRQEGVADPVAILEGCVKAYAASDVVKKGKVWGARKFFEEGHHKDDPMVWADTKPKEADEPNPYKVYNDPTLEQLQAEQVDYDRRYEKMDEATKKFYSRSSSYGKRAAGKSEIVTGGASIPDRVDGNEVPGQGLQVPLP